MKWNFCVSVPLIYWYMIVCKGELLTFRQNLNNLTENDIKLAFLMALNIFSYFPFGFEGRIWDLIVSVPDHCLSFYF